MINICIIGSGNVAHHLIAAFEQTSEIEVVQVYSRRNVHFRTIEDSTVTDDLSELIVADLYIIAVSDNAIAEISGMLPFSNRLVVHTSGSVSIEDLDKKNRRGVFYPLQTFTSSKEIDFAQVPICLESDLNEDVDLLKKVAATLSESIFMVTSAQRKALHIAAVFVSNFTNHLYKLGKDICVDNHLPFEILRPLIKETAAKIEFIDPSLAQTGPARRNDIETINAHLQFLEDEKLRKIYKLITESIQQNG